MRITGVEENLVLIDRKVAMHAARTRATDALNLGLVAARILPEKLSCSRVYRLDDLSRIGDIHDAIVDERCRLLRAVGQTPAPH